MKGKPLLKIKKQISKIATTATVALMKKIALKTASLKACFVTSCPF
ncbi:Uncharacterised protein [Streptococcus pneumoniae]|nr:Uncharacterised protein [Streptococcus pneumoniae]